MKVQIKLLRENAIMPTSHNSEAAGIDCYISGFCRWNDALGKMIEYDSKEIELYKGNIIGCRLGFSTELPKGYYAKVLPRSGLALKHGITIVNSPGTIDSDYRGEWIAIVTNLSKIQYKVSIGDKICQFILEKCIKTDVVLSKVLEDSDRGENGFGSSGK